MINIKNLDPNEIKIEYKHILIYYINYETTSNVKPLLINKINGYIDKNNEDKNFTLGLTDKSKKKYLKT